MISLQETPTVRGVWPIPLGYVLVFLLLGWVSYIRPLQGLNITPWNPQPGLAVAVLLWNRRWLRLVWISLAAAELVVRGVPKDGLVAFAATAALLGGTIHVATFFAGGIGPDGPVLEAVACYWIGDAVALLVMLPIQLVLLDGRRRAALLATLRAPRWWTIAALNAASGRVPSSGIWHPQLAGIGAHILAKRLWRIGSYRRLLS